MTDKPFTLMTMPRGMTLGGMDATIREKDIGGFGDFYTHGCSVAFGVCGQCINSLDCNFVYRDGAYYLSIVDDADKEFADTEKAYDNFDALKMEVLRVIREYPKIK